jgi:hypothetical protein
MGKRLILSLVLIILFWVIMYALGQNIREITLYVIGCAAVGWHMNTVSDWILDR